MKGMLSISTLRHIVLSIGTDDRQGTEDRKNFLKDSKAMKGYLEDLKSDNTLIAMYSQDIKEIEMYIEKLRESDGK